MRLRQGNMLAIDWQHFCQGFAAMIAYASVAALKCDEQYLLAGQVLVL